MCMMPVVTIVWACPNAAGLWLLRKHACHSCADSDRGTRTRTSLDTNPFDIAVCIVGQMARRAQKKETISTNILTATLPTPPLQKTLGKPCVETREQPTKKLGVDDIMSLCCRLVLVLEFS